MSDQSTPINLLKIKISIGLLSGANTNFRKEAGAFIRAGHLFGLL